MKEHFRKCYRCEHPFHALGKCSTWSLGDGYCGCDGSWDVGLLDLSGFCFAYNLEEAAHQECPGEDYTYPCECPCHGDAF